MMDTKYKAPASPAPADLAQVVAYAEAKGCSEALLVYPSSLPNPLDIKVGDIRVRSLPFSVDGDLNHAGQSFVQNMLPSTLAKAVR